MTRVDSTGDTGGCCCGSTLEEPAGMLASVVVDRIAMNVLTETPCLKPSTENQNLQNSSINRMRA